MAHTVKKGPFLAFASAWAICLSLIAAPFFASSPVSFKAKPAMVLAPMMDLTPCLLATEATALTQPCIHGSAAAWVKATLAPLENNANWTWGYTLKVPLLQFLVPNAKSDALAWEVNSQAIERVAQTIRDTDKPVIVYLFANHFSTGAPIEKKLSLDANNLAFSPLGPMPVDSYYGEPLYPWSISSTNNDITRYREKVIHALTQQLCDMPSGVVQRIRGMTLLGEVHQMFLQFESGMGFEGPFLAGDYSPASTTGFRQYLQARFKSLHAFNQAMQSQYTQWSEVLPPSKDIRRTPLTRYQEHIDSFSFGSLPVTGWVHVPHAKRPPSVQVYLNGSLTGQAAVQLGRQDVRAAHPEFPTADVGWRYDLDFRKLPAGTHRIDLVLDNPGQPLARLATRSISIMDASQAAPLPQPMKVLPTFADLPAQVIAYTDAPRDQADYYFNPLASEWLKYREQQVVDYLQHFNKLLASSCLGKVPRYTHQILPHYNPSWDSHKFAVNASLQTQTGLRTGISLYGEPSYGASLPQWLQLTGHQRYGITEFHPLKAMSPQGLQKVWRQHQQQGADFLSFFLETRFQGQAVNAKGNLFSFDPSNAQFGSDHLYRSAAQVAY